MAPGWAGWDKGDAVAKFALVYVGGGGMPETEEEGQAIVKAWTDWFTALGAGVVDPGNPFGASKSLAPDGSATEPATTGLSGYTIIQADDLGTATDLAKGCPILAAGGTVDVYETFDIM